MRQFTSKSTDSFIGECRNGGLAAAGKGNHGFTMLELIVVFILIAVISAVVAVRVLNTDIDLITETELIKTHLRYAQGRAMNSNSIWGINLTGSTYSLFRNGNVANKVSLPSEEVDTRSLPTGVTIEAAIISFDAWGIPHTNAAATDGNELVTGDTEAQITVTDGSDTRAITITPNTGFIP